MTAPADFTPNKPAGESSLVEDFIDVFFAPAAMFARRASKGPWVPFLIVAVLMAGLYFVNTGNMQGVFDAEVARAIAQASEQNPNMTAEQLEGMRGVMEASMKWGGVVIMPVLLLCVGLITWLVGKVLGAPLGFGTGLGIASFAYVPKVLEFVLFSVQAIVLDTASYTGRYSASWGVGRFLDPSGKQGLYNFLGRLDLFTLWVTVLLVIGLIHAGKMDKSKAFVAGGVLWILGALPPIWQMIQGV